MICPPTFSIASAISTADARCGAFERHMLEKMRDAVFRRGLVAGAGADIGAEGDRLHPLHPFGQHGQAGGQRGDRNVFSSFQTFLFGKIPDQPLDMRQVIGRLDQKLLPLI